MTIDVKDQLADGEVFQRDGDDIVGLELPDAESSADIIPDLVTSPGNVQFNLAPLVTGAEGLQLAGGMILASAKMATTEALPACTYSNGSSGQGATLTGNSNGALGAIDTVTSATADFILVKNQATTYQNGLYEITDVGSAGAPFVLTRAAHVDSAADLLAGVGVLVARGRVNKGQLWVAQDSVTVGTTAINWRGVARPAVTPADAQFGSTRDRQRYFTDFEELETAIPANTSARMIGTAFTLTTAGTAGAISQVGSSTTTFGALRFDTGTTTTGFARVRAGAFAFTFDTAKRYRMAIRCKVPNASTGSETFEVIAGSMPGTFLSAGTAPADGIYFLAPADGSNWDCVTMLSSTPTTTDSGVAVSTSYQMLAIWYDEIAATAYFYINGTLVASHTTNLPASVSLASGVGIVKSAGTTARTLDVDLLAFDHLSPRPNLLYVP